MMGRKFKTIIEIEEENEKKEREKLKKAIVNDFNDVLGGLFPKREKLIKKFSFLKWFSILVLFLFLTTLFLGFIFLIKFFIKGIF